MGLNTNNVEFSTDANGNVTGLAGLGGVTIPMNAYQGLVATRCGVPTTFSPANKQAMSRTKHIATEYLTSLSVVFANYYATSTGEQLTGGTATFKASIEYPAGTIAGVFTFSGSTSGTAADGGTVTSDKLTLPVVIPAGATFFLRTFCNTVGGIVYSANPGLNNQTGVIPLSGEWCTFGVTTTDYTGVATNVNNQALTVVFRPLAILGMTVRPTIFLAGDSRCGNGVNYDTVATAYGGTGEVERGLGKKYAIFNGAVAGDRLQYWAGTQADKRLQMAAYCSHVVIQLGINDVAVGRSLSAITADLDTLTAKFSGKPVYPCTLSPYSTSTDSWTTTGNQTTNGNNAQRTAYNNRLRACISGSMAGYIEIADQTESARDSGLWKVTGVANGYTSDGVHGNTAAMVLIENSTAFQYLDVLLR